MADMNAKNGRSKGHGRLYRTLVSVKTSLVFLAVFAIMFFLGTVFPQSSDPNRLEQYREAGGKFIGLVGALDLLNLFRSPFFIVLILLFMIHLLLCVIHRIGILRKRPTFRLFTREDLLQRDHSFSVVCPAESVVPDVEKTLKRLGFRRWRYYSEHARVKRVVCEKGLPFRWLSWLYHVCFLLAIVGFILSYLFAFEDYITLGVGEAESIALSSPETNWRKLMRSLGAEEHGRPREIELELDEFITEHIEKPSLKYPDGRAERLLSAWGLGKEPVHYEMPDDPLYPRDWFSALRVYDGGESVLEKKIEVNDPLRYAGLTFYQIGYEYEFDLTVGGEILEDIKAREPFTIPQMEGEFRISAPHVGILFGYDGGVERLEPSAKLQHRPPSGAEEPKWSTAGEIASGRSTEVMHAEMKLDSIRASSVLSYRYDPGVPLLWVAGIGLVILVAARIYLPWYQVRCHVDGSSDRALISVSIRMVGLFARPERLRQRLSKAFLG